MHVPYSELFRVFGRIGLLSFGGPAAQISLMQTELVDRHQWLSEAQFLRALSFCMLLPGPEAMQLATYCGWRMRGVGGGVLAGLLFVLPGAAVIVALALGYAHFGQLPLVQSLFAGIKATVVIIVFQALFKLAGRALSGWMARSLALLAFAAIFFLSVPFPVIIVVATIIGLASPAQISDTSPPVTSHTHSTLATLIVWGSIWAAPIGLVWMLQADLLIEMALFFSKLAVVTFGGAYAVLAYMTQEIVQSYGWLTTAEMIDSLGLAETTPGPLILVTEFTAFLAGFKEGGIGLGAAAAAITLWVTFAPCFLWIFVAAPYVENLLSKPRLKGAFDAISACVAGVILNLATWFALHVLFASVPQTQFGPLPDLTSFSLFHAGLIGIAAVLLLWLRWSMVITLVVMAALAAVAQPILSA